ncbi:MAG: hypothetical protein F6J98_41585, partial [Moorea sp. SIO4G2]|nr:hypothetical protein [Moorena sp. SIO4G2]
VRENSDRLKFQNWSQVGFYERGYKGSKTEAMPVLISEAFQKFGEIRYLSGGVSLAGKDIFKGRAILPKTSKAKQLALRSDVDYSTFNLIDDSLNFKTLNGTNYQLKTSKQNLSLVTAKAKQGTKFRSPDAKLKNQAFSRTVSQYSSRIEIDTSVGKTELGSFSVNKTQNSFTVGFKGRDIDAGHSLGLRLSRSKGSWEQALKEMPDVQVAFKSRRQPPHYIVQMSDSKKWLKITPEPRAATGGGGSKPPKPPKDWDIFVGDLGDDSRHLGMSWLDDQQIKQQQAAGNLEKIKQFVDDDFPKDPKVEEFGKKLQNGRYPQVAVEIADDPVQFLLLKKKHSQVKLNKIDRLLMQGKNAKAAQLIDELIQVYGPEPDLIMRKALIKLRQVNLNVKQIFPDASAKPTNFLDIIESCICFNSGKFTVITFQDSIDFVEEICGFG